MAKKKEEKAELVKRERRGGILNWLWSIVAGVGCMSILALACAFVAIKLFPDFFEGMSEENQTLLKILTALMVITAGRFAYLLARKR